MPTFPGAKNVLDQPIYDTIQLAVAAAQVVHFFTVPLNGALTAAANKTYEHTNLVQAGRLESGNQLHVTGLSFFAKQLASGGAAPTLADLTALYSGWIQFNVGQVSYLRLPIAMIPNGGAEPVPTGNGAAASTHLAHGISAISNRFHFKNPFTIEADEAIDVEFHVTAAVAAVTDVVFVIWGDYERPLR